MNDRTSFFIFFLIISIISSSRSTCAKDFVPLDVADGLWAVELNFENMLTPKQKAQMKTALGALEKMKKTNPAMAAQLSQATGALGMQGTSVTKENCVNHNDMKNGVNKMLNQESSSDSKCRGEIIKSTAKLMEGKSICGNKTYEYKVSVISKKEMKYLITTHDGKTIKGHSKWKANKCTPESRVQ